MEMLLWRIEYKNIGPFADSENWEYIQDRIAQLGPRIDNCKTTFFNIYDQTSSPPWMIKEFREAFDPKSGVPTYPNLKFGFNSKEALEDSLRIDANEEFGGVTWPNYGRFQFLNLLDNEPDFQVKVFLAEPRFISQRESIFDPNEATLVEVLNSAIEYEKA